MNGLIMLQYWIAQKALWERDIIQFMHYEMMLIDVMSEIYLTL
jgi:hypothetical protein